MNKDLLSGFDVTPEDISRILDLTKKIKKRPISQALEHKTVGLSFQKASARTRISFEVGAYQLGAQCVYLAPQDIRLGEREPVKDSGRVFSRYLDAIVTRTFSHAIVEELARYASIPVINGLSDLYHPCQALADMFTVFERCRTLSEVTLCYIGDGNNVLHSLLAVGAQCGMRIVVATPKRYEPDRDIWRQAQECGRKTGARLELLHSPEAAVRHADFIYTDVWVSMGQESQTKKRMKVFQPFQLNASLLRQASKQAYIMHCMPVHRGQEMTDDVAESSRSIMIDQAENRMHVQKALLLILMGANRRSGRKNGVCTR